ncbi:MAG TPA: hypothetical protein VKU41_29510, partial [Polyangiaceae bacterium]|nr:hypothetical protein [Polyangiaceae bacterium]
MDVLAAILTCSLYADDALVRAIVDNAHDNPFAILTPEIEGGGEGETQPRDRETALAKLEELTGRGDRPLLGLMQVPVAWASFFGREPQELFDPCVNLSIGSAMLSEFDYACARGIRSHSSGRTVGSPARRPCATLRYAEAVGVPELTTVVTLNLRYQRPDSSTPSAAPIFSSALDQGPWGARRMLVLTDRGVLDQASRGGRSPSDAGGGGNAS